MISLHIKKSLKERKIQRPSKIKDDLKNMLDHLKIANDILEKSPASLKNLLIDYEDELLIFRFHDDLRDLICKIHNKVNDGTLNDGGGIQSGSVKKFIIFHLLKIYIQTTKEFPKFGWDYNKGKGSFFEFLDRCKKICPVIKAHLTNNKTVYNNVGD